MAGAVRSPGRFFIAVRRDPAHRFVSSAVVLSYQAFGASERLVSIGDYAFVKGRLFLRAASPFF